jgi:hypothetical protein
MKITKQRILEIIKEEVEAAQQDDSNTKQKLRKDFLTVAKEFIPDADMASAEVELTSALMNKILKKAGEAGTSATQLKRLNDIAGKLLSEAQKDIVDEVGAYFKSLEASGKEIYELVGFPNTKPESWRKVSELRFSPRTTGDYNVMNALLEVVPEQGEKIQMNFTTDKEVKNLMNLYKTKEEVEKLTAAAPEQNKDSAETAPATEPVKKTDSKDEPKGQQVQVGNKTYNVVAEEYPKVQKAFKRFKEKFLTVRLLKDQDKLIGDLRAALSRFLGLEGPDDQEVAINEVEEKKQPQQDKSKIFNSLSTDVGRLRRDLNDSVKVLEQYEEKSNKGVYAAELVLKRLKRELTDVQDSNRKVIEDLTKLSPNHQFEINEEQESRKDKIAKVEAAYDEIVKLLEPIIARTIPATEKPSADKEQDDSIEEQIINKVLNILTEQDNSLEIASLAEFAEKALEQINGIKKYFRVTGTFSKPLPKIKREFKTIIEDYQKVLGDLVTDIRQQRAIPRNIQIYINMFKDISSNIQEFFGISPREPIIVKNPDGTKDVIASVQDVEKDTTAAISTEAEKAASTTSKPEDKPAEVTPEFEQSAKEYYRDSQSFSIIFDRIIDLIEKKDDKQLRKIIAKLKTPPKEVSEDIDKDYDLIDLMRDIEETIITMLRADTINELTTNRKKDFRELHTYYKNARIKLKKLIDAQDPGEQMIDSLEIEIEKIKKYFNKEKKDLVSYYLKRAEEFGKIARELEQEPAKKAAAEKKREDNKKAAAKIYNVEKAMLSDFSDIATDADSIYSNFKNQNYQTTFKAGGEPKVELEESKNLLERLIREELKVLNGKKMVRN